MPVKPQVFAAGNVSPLLGQQERAVPVDFILPPAHPKQLELINAFDARITSEGAVVYDPRVPGYEELPKAFPDLKFVVGACGTKFGKTYGCAILVCREAWDNRGSLNWWVAPVFKQAEMAYRLVKRILPKDSYVEYKADLRLELLEPDGSVHSTIEFKSAENDDSLRGFGVNFCILDEAARVKQVSYESLLTTMMQTDGRMVIISTPKGRNWFYDVYQRGEKILLPGEKDEWPEWKSIRMPTWTNPYVKAKRIDMMRRNMPVEVFKQEVAAQFMRDSAGVFNGVDACIKPGLTDSSGRPIWELPVKGHRYVIGVDLARKRDWTVITVMDCATKRLVYWDRFNDIQWSVQKSRIIKVAKEYNNAVVWMDGTGLGDPIVEDVRAAGCRVECYIIGRTTKQEMIEKLRTSLEFQRFTMPVIPTLVKELRDYEYQINSNGNIKYDAPSGSHDDCVISLALANMGLEKVPIVFRASQVRGI